MTKISKIKVQGVTHEIKDNEAYVKPVSGIPASDIAEGVIPDISGKQDTLVSGENIKTINNQSILGEGNLIIENPDISEKADKVSNATSGNFAALDSEGNLTDSGHKHSDYLTEHQDISGKQDVITDLATIRSGAAAGATAYQKPSTGIPADALSSAVQTSLGKADTALQSYTEIDPTVPSWAKQSDKPSYTKSEVGLGNVTNDAQVKRTEMGAASGVATLGTDGKVPASQLPSYVDDVLEYDSSSDFPLTGESGKIYVAKDTNKTYRWSGTGYIEISPSIVIGTTTGTAYDGGSGAALANKLSGIEDGAQVHRAPTATEVKSALGTGSGTTKYLREDGSWATPPDTDTWRPLGTTADTACAGNDSRLSDARPASDVYAWAKEANKPSYSYNEISDTPSIPSKTSDLTNDSGFLTEHQDISGKADKSEMAVSTSGDQTTITLKSGTSATVINAHQDISGKEDVSNKVTSLSSENTDTQYPSAKAVYNAIKTIDSSDLSHFDVFGNHLIAQNTANSYIVHRPGIYKIPLIYGNGIINSKINAPAYTKLASDYTADFVNHLGNAITSPYIEENSGCIASSAGLLWQTSNCINAVNIAEDLGVKYLMFVVNSIPDTNADAVLYVKDANDNIMWSWTIWMINNLPNNVDIVNYTGVTYTMMGLPFGAIWNAEKTKYVVPLYQWGRKDPMVPAAAYNSNSNMTVYDINGDVYSGFGALGTGNDSLATKTVANSIQNPNLFFTFYNTTTYNWNDLSWMNNFWNAAETSSSSLADNQATAIKTIYDPSPVGYMLPSGRFATGFTTTGTNTSTPSEFNVIGSFDNGRTFKKNSTDETGIYFPAAGCRDGSSSDLDATGSFGLWWSFAPSSQASARLLYFGSGYVSPLNSLGRAGGFGVWAALELH